MPDILYGIKKVVLEENDLTTGLPKAGGVVCNITTAEEADLEPVISEGKEDVLRTDDKILAIARTDDLLYGYNLTFKDNKFDANVASLIEGGVITLNGQDISKYDSPKLADGATMKQFTMTIYVANYSGDNIVNYTKIVFANCKGKAPKLSFKKEFFAPEFAVKARENTRANLPVKQISYVDTLPADDVTAPTVTKTSGVSVTKPAPVIAKTNEVGGLYLALAAATVDSLADLTALVNMGLASYVSAPLADTDANIPTSALAAGNYKIYAVDMAGNVSTGVAVTVA